MCSAMLQGPRRRGGWGGYSPPTFFVNHIRFSNLTITILNAHKKRPDRLCLLDVIVTKIGIEISVALMNRTVISLHVYALFVKKIVKIVLLVTGIITLVLVFVKRLLR